MSEKIKFVGRLLDGEKMTDLCQEFGISRKTGYKIFHRYEMMGIKGLEERSRAAKRRPNQTPPSVEKKILNLKKKYPSWGSPKIKAYLEKKPTDYAIPAKSTVHSILERHNLVSKRRRAARAKAKGTRIHAVEKANDTWCTDFKGQFRLKNHKYCYPLTVTDQHSRYLLACEALESTKEDEVIDIFSSLFEEHGLPAAIRSDNGVPFATNSNFGLSKLSVNWLRNGIRLERIEPGHPEQNGSHERMHRTLKHEATKPPCASILRQQEVFDNFCSIYNNERPHEALNMKCPVDLYKKSKVKYILNKEPLEYPEHDLTLRVSRCGGIRFKNRLRVYIGLPFMGENLGVREVDDGIWQVHFMHYEMGYFDFEDLKLKPSHNPFLI